MLLPFGPNHKAWIASKVHIRDARGMTVAVTLWGCKAEAFDAEKVYADGQPNPQVVIFVGTLVKLYRGSADFSLSGGAACQCSFQCYPPKLLRFVMENEKHVASALFLQHNIHSSYLCIKPYQYPLRPFSNLINQITQYRMMPIYVMQVLLYPQMPIHRAGKDNETATTIVEHTPCSSSK